MKIKKLLSILACLGLSITLLAGCASPSTTAPSKDKTETSTEVPSDAVTLETDVIVIGAGGGGLSAAIEAHDAGANVILVEKMPFVGGNTA
ncbi:MAG: FAD-binding protein, partial [Cellulosilyticaceae bacterium]